MKVTLNDIAEKSGYSVSTVSRVLNGSGKISTKTQEKIVAAALELDFPIYKINQPIGNYRTPNLMLVTDFHDSEFYSVYFNGFAKAAHNQNYRLALTSVTNPREEVIDTLMTLIGSDVDGIILFIPELQREDYTTILDKLPDNYPIVSNALVESPIITTVTFDGYSGGHKAARHLEERGYNRVGLIKGPSIKAESRFRTNGFKDYINHSDSLKLTWEFEGDFSYNSGLAAYQDFITLKDPPEAVFGASDLMSLAFMEELKRSDYTIPEDVALLSYDDLPLCQRTYPNISAVKTDFRELANRTIKTLIQQTKTKENGIKQGILSQIPVDLVQREST
jgi:DNA-binding LacI/PurR family transcriptional regulator